MALNSVDSEVNDLSEHLESISLSGMGATGLGIDGINDSADLLEEGHDEYIPDSRDANRGNKARHPWSAGTCL